MRFALTMRFSVPVQYFATVYEFQVFSTIPQSKMMEYTLNTKVVANWAIMFIVVFRICICKTLAAKVFIQILTKLIKILRGILMRFY